MNLSDRVAVIYEEEVMGEVDPKILTLKKLA